MPGMQEFDDDDFDDDGISDEEDDWDEVASVEWELISNDFDADFIVHSGEGQYLYNSFVGDL